MGSAFSDVPVRANGGKVTPAWWNQLRTAGITDAYKILSFVDDSAFITAKGSAASDGDVYYSTTRGRIRYYDDLNSVWRDAGSGSSTNGINYCTNGDFEINDDGWETYADAAGTSPVNGTGGTANITAERSETDPLRETGSLLITKDAANRQGQGVSYDFEIDTADICKVLSVEFDYYVASGTYATGDITMWVYDIDNAVVIQLAPHQIQASSIQESFKAVFQTNTSTGGANAKKYRLIFHVASTSASAYTVKIDNVKVGPQQVISGSPVTDWQAWTPTITNGGTTSANVGYWRRVGDSIELFVKTTFSAAGASAALTYTLPLGFNIDSSKISSATYSVYGIAEWLDSGTDFNTGMVTWGSSTTLLVILHDANGAFQGNSLANGDIVTFNAKIPILGWGSTVQMSDSADTRVVALSATKAASNHDSSGSLQDAAVWTTVTDSHGAFNATTGVYTVKVPGVYRVYGQIGFAANATGVRYSAVVLGSTIKAYGVPMVGSASISGISAFACNMDCVAGDTIKVQGYQNSGGTLAYTADVNCRLHIERLSGPSQIAASEKVVACYKTAAAQSIDNASAEIVDFGTKVFDTHGAVTTGASWKFTAPVAGYYVVSVFTMPNTGGGWAAGEEWTNLLYQNNAEVGRLGSYYAEASHSNPTPANGTRTIYMAAGDYIDVRVYQSSGGALALINADTANWISIHRI